MACLWIGAIISNNKKIMLFSYGGEPDTANGNLRIKNLVELTGIEPVTSCLQSTRSPS
jgi:hypothetical protein